MNKRFKFLIATNSYTQYYTDLGQLVRIHIKKGQKYLGIIDISCWRVFDGYGNFFTYPGSCFNK